MTKRCPCDGKWCDHCGSGDHCDLVDGPNLNPIQDNCKYGWVLPDRCRYTRHLGCDCGAYPPMPPIHSNHWDLYYSMVPERQTWGNWAVMLLVVVVMVVVLWLAAGHP